MNGHRTRPVGLGRTVITAGNKQPGKGVLGCVEISPAETYRLTDTGSCEQEKCVENPPIRGNFRRCQDVLDFCPGKMGMSPPLRIGITALRDPVSGNYSGITSPGLELLPSVYTPGF